MIPFNKNISDYFMTFIYPFREKVIIPKISRNYNSCINYFLYVIVYIYKLKFIYEVTNTITKWLKKEIPFKNISTIKILYILKILNKSLCLEKNLNFLYKSMYENFCPSWENNANLSSIKNNKSFNNIFPN